MRHLIRLIVVWPLVLLIVFMHMLISALFYLWPFFSSPGAMSSALARQFIRAILALVGVRVKVEGLSHVPEQDPLIVMSNHESMLDILVLFAAVPAPHWVSFISKSAYKYVPVLGQCMMLSGSLYVDRENPRKAKQDMIVIREKLSAGRCILMFPEGTRSRDGQLAMFKRGGAQLALETGIPIVPVALKGAGALLAPNAFLNKPGTVTVRFGPVIAAPEIGDAAQIKEEALALSSQVRGVVEGLLKG